MKVVFNIIFIAAMMSFAVCCTGENDVEKLNQETGSNGTEIVKEKYEWCNIWWDHANDKKSPRVLIIGDSISVGYGEAVTKALDGKTRVDRLSVSFGITDPALLKYTKLMLGEYKYSAISFNNGLHGWHITDDQYESGLRDFAIALKQLAPNTPVIWVNSTPVGQSGNPTVLNSELNPIAVKRNEIAAKVMSELKIPIVDLYNLVIDKPELKVSDGGHFKKEGSEVLGAAVARAFEEALSDK